MNESLLKKDFKESDLNRIRNLVKKDFKSSTKLQVGYKKREEEHVEGDIWDEDNRTWTIKNGIKTNITKLDNIRKLLQVPFLCPICGRSLKHKNDVNFYKFHKKCFNCVVEYETKMRIEGKWEDYVKNGIKQNFEWFVKDLRDGIDNYIKSVDNDSYISESGDIEKWSGNKINEEKVRADVEEYIADLQSKLNI